MNSHVDRTLVDLRSAVGATNDAELARRLHINQSTISSWKSRGRVPRKFVKMLDASDDQLAEAPKYGGELQERGTAVALIRFTLLRHELASSGNTDRALAVLLDLRPFWLLMNKAIHDIQEKMHKLRVDLSTAHALVSQEDLRDPEATRRRINAEMAEDARDNPWLADYK